MHENIKRIYHPYTLWEEIAHNMWGVADDKELCLKIATVFTGDHKIYGEHMMKVATSWKYSCENALTDRNLNRRAWIGHAACALYKGIPENIVRQAWGSLTDEQRILANKEADNAIREWEFNYIKDKKLYQDMGRPLLFKWDS